MQAKLQRFRNYELKLGIAQATEKQLAVIEIEKKLAVSILLVYNAAKVAKQQESVSSSSQSIRN